MFSWFLCPVLMLHSPLCVCVRAWVLLVVNVLLVGTHYHIEIQSPTSSRLLFSLKKKKVVQRGKRDFDAKKFPNICCRFELMTPFLLEEA